MNCQAINKYNISTCGNLFTLFLLLFGSILYHYTNFIGSKYILSFGLFGIAGGITNWIAIQMLFDEIPFLYGSGVIQREFTKIKQSIKNIIMKTFFNPTELENYIYLNISDFLQTYGLKDKISNYFENDNINPILEEKLNTLTSEPLMMMMITMSGGLSNSIKVIKPIIIKIGHSCVDLLLEKIQKGDKLIDINLISNEIDKLIDQKLLEMGPEDIKSIIEDIIRKHLGWLIVWGNLFGGLLGIICQVCGYGI
jgi:uncharacterized membrane protein YheB (UPF0754 family)